METETTKTEGLKMKEWMRSAGLLLIWPLVVLKEGVDAGDTFTGLLFGSSGLVVGFAFPPLLIFGAGITSPVIFVIIALVYLVAGILVHLELYSEWKVNILRLPIHQ